jgi:metal-responsive CopG/Arc/MetJ family transcriptional regulator
MFETPPNHQGIIMPRKNNAENMVTTSIKAMRTQIEGMDKLVEAGEFSNRNEAIRAAIREYLANHPTMGGAALCRAQ